MTADTPQPRTAKSDTKVALMCVAGVVTMGCMAYAAVPLYQMFCQVTGLGGTTQKAEKAPDVVYDRTVTVRSTPTFRRSSAGLSSPCSGRWKRTSGEQHAGVLPRNQYDRPADYGHGDVQRGARRGGTLLQQDRVLLLQRANVGAGSVDRNAVSFFVDPGLVKDPESSRLKEITLSYTFYPIEGDKAAEAKTGKENRS